MTSEGLRFNSPHYQSMGFRDVSWIGSRIVWSNAKTPLLEREREREREREIMCLKVKPAKYILKNLI